MSRLPRKRPGRREREMNPIMQAAATHLYEQQQQNDALALTLLREALVRLGVRSELRDNDSALMITGRGRRCRCGCSSATAAMTSPGSPPRSGTR